MNVKKIIVSAISIVFAATLVYYAVQACIAEYRISKISINALSAAVMDMDSGKVLYGKEINRQVPPGSITKLVSVMVVFDKIKSGELSLTDTVTVSDKASAVHASKVNLKPGEKMSVHDLIKCALIPSGSDAILALAEHISGTERDFVLLMNEKVKELELVNSRFDNCIGIESINNYSDAYDIAVVAKKIYSDYPEIFEYTKLNETTVLREDGSTVTLNSTNDMLGRNGVNGLKTGSTPQSGYSLAFTYCKNRKNLVFVVMNAQSIDFRKNDCEKLYEIFAR